MLKKIFTLILILSAQVIFAAYTHYKKAKHKITTHSPITNLTDTVVFDLSKAMANIGNFDIPISFLSHNEITSFQFSLQFNTSKLNYIEVAKQNKYLLGLAGYEKTDNTLNFTATSLHGMGNDSIFALIRFSYKNPNMIINQSDSYSIKVYINGEPCNYKLIMTATQKTFSTITSISNCVGLDNPR